MDISKQQLSAETTFCASRSSGKGGQNVNKVSSRVELIFDVNASDLFSDQEKQLLLSKLVSKLNKDGAVHVVCDEERSQYLNREKALEKLYQIIIKAFEKPKPRKPTKISKAAKAKRTEQKQLQSVKKNSRRKNFDF
ncbi:alternative ribosome rescue aminoacyl-tRNA hydrolase ArfB [Mucilaginibacter ginkgonis]|uniref:Aminoacyl-tRNA hydrolase n=1 Tax=Mucilaginibacter ginkgonis TaxID=2682091 RepID=A0A6I4I3C0_9SPHI|nr:alternative ribosome rescue aminoacyl-tRNA hydrolase ArfB [Mucilaginibacter ginkgonis]QQL48462.1 aminoacyl-tRNA hydrolase [Mucilaginibacter ginkgonis]